MWNFILGFILLTGGHRALGILHHVCPEKHIVSQINSPSDKDHQWKIECRAFGSISRCSWYRPGNKNIDNNCPAGHVVAGIYSTHGVRSWKILCCSVPNLITSECRKTPMVTYANKDFNWKLPAGHFLTGVRIHRDNINGDHRRSFIYCKGTTKDPQRANSEILAVTRLRDAVAARKKRNARVDCDDCRWPKTHDMVHVPYNISDAFTEQEKGIIQSAMCEFNLTTCVQFVPHKTQTSYISIVKTEATCESEVGRAGGKQELSLSEGCVRKGNIQHELIHSLGFWHEQNRSDRDDYVIIHYENIIPKQSKNFRKLETDNLGVPYDYGSVMHYGKKTFSRNGRDTIETIDPSAEIGQREGMSKIDILKINKLYDCKNYVHKHVSWDNLLRSSFSRICPSGHAVSGIKSLYVDGEKDRRWAFSCKALNMNAACKWSGPVSKFKKAFTYKCEGHGVIAAVNSIYSISHQDRQWEFYCCSGHGLTTSHCHTTKIEDIDEYFRLTPPTDSYLTGVRSTFDANKHYRGWFLTFCRVHTHGGHHGFCRTLPDQ